MNQPQKIILATPEHDFEGQPEVTDQDQPIREWEFVQIQEAYRIYFKPSDTDFCGFRFYILEWSGEMDFDQKYNREARWNYVVAVNVLFHGQAYFDGIRHMWPNCEWQDHYFQYVDTKAFAECFAELRKLEEKFCRISELP